MGGTSVSDNKDYLDISKNPRYSYGNRSAPHLATPPPYQQAVPPMYQQQPPSQPQPYQTAPALQAQQPRFQHNQPRPPLGLSTAFISPNPTSIIISDQSGTHGGYDIRTSQGQLIVGCTGKSLSSKKFFTAPNGQPVFQFNRKHFSFSDKYELVAPNGQIVCTFTGRLSFSKTKVDIEFRNTAADGAPTLLNSSSRSWSSDTDVSWNGVNLARFRTENKSFWSSKKIYYIDVQPGVDLSLVCALVVAIEECRKESNAAAAGAAGGAAGGGGA